LDLRFCGLDGIQSSRAEEDSTMAIGFKVNTNVVLFGFMMEMLDTSGDTRDRDFLKPSQRPTRVSTQCVT
jgi:hypothetical protein